MSNQNEKDGELFELNKDLNNSQNLITELTDLENQLSQYKNYGAPLYLKNTIITKANRTTPPLASKILPMAVSLLLFIIGGILFFLYSFPKPEIHIQAPQPSGEKSKVASILGKELGINSPKEQKYYAFYYSSSLCKPCIDLLAELDNFYLSQKAINPDFEIIYIEIDKHVPIGNKQNALHIKKIDFKNLQDKDFFKQFKEGHGPSFVVVDKNGKVIAKHKKNMHQKTFSTVLTTFSDLLAKS